MRAALLLLACMLLAGCSSGGGDDAPPAQVHQVSIHGGNFDPTTLQMPAGDTLRFENHEGMAHTATAASSPMGSLDSGDLGEGQHHDFEGMQAGTYTFTCRHHAAMRVTVTVTG